MLLVIKYFQLDSVFMLEKAGVQEGRSPSFYIIPPPLSREGDKGGGLPNKLICASSYGRDIISPTEVLRQESFKG